MGLYLLENRLQIVYMTAEDNLAPISLVKDIKQPYNRFGTLTKQEIIRSCWLSINEGLSEQDTIHLLAAGVSNDSLNWFDNTCKATLRVVTVPTMAENTPPYGTHPYPQYSEVRVNHFIPQYEYFISLLEQNPSDIYYYSSDDYLHLPDAMFKIKNLFDQGFNGFFVPQDYPDSYNENTRHAELFLSNYGYLRTVESATPNIVARGDVWLRFKFDMLKASVFADDGWTWKAFKQIKAFAPMPGWSTHLQTGCLSPFVDWDKVAQHYLERLK